jgi:hypothetical protein
LLGIGHCGNHPNIGQTLKPCSAIAGRGGALVTQYFMRLKGEVNPNFFLPESGRTNIYKQRLDRHFIFKAYQNIRISLWNAQFDKFKFRITHGAGVAPDQSSFLQ